MADRTHESNRKNDGAFHDSTSSLGSSAADLGRPHGRGRLGPAEPAAARQCVVGTDGRHFHQAREANGQLLRSAAVRTTDAAGVAEFHSRTGCTSADNGPGSFRSSLEYALFAKHAI